MFCLRKNMKKCFEIFCVCDKVLSKEIAMERVVKKVKNPTVIGGFFPSNSLSIAISVC